MSHTVVLGGGICGLVAGYTLSERGEQVTVLEAQESPGGLATTLPGATGAGFDFGPHAYHARNQRVLDLFAEIASDGFPARAKNVSIKFRGRYYKYPLEAMDIARSMPPLLALRAFLDFFIEVVRRRVRPRRIVSAEDWVTQGMGRTLYGLFFGPYTAKVWGMPASQLAASFAQHKIPQINLWKVAVSSFRKGLDKVTEGEHKYAPLVVQLYYPPKGAGLISTRIADRIRAASPANRVITQALVTGIDVEGDRVVGVRYRRVASTKDDGQLCLMATGTEENVRPYRFEGPEERIACDRVVNTLPLPALFALMGDAVSPAARDAARVLRFRAVSIVGLRFRRPSVLPAQSVYFQDKMFNRVSETRLYGGTEICGPDETVVLCDVTCEVNDAVWNTPAEELGRRCARELAAEGFCREEDLAESVVLRTTCGYPVYVVGYERAIATLLAELLPIENLVTGGRQGLYKYVDMDIAAEMGIAMAEHFLAGRSKREAIAHVPYEERMFA
ncbi:MAG: FAD-dependent oxidoreductase [Candidatus Limnocylindria bacterium]|nr:FAD-dependent oxidoreductase [Candidatus Limnocylindria bacterium]